MKRLLILVLVTAILGAAYAPAQSADATAAWNSVAASYNFETVNSNTTSSTFAEAYSGADLNSDLQAALQAVQELMNTSSFPPISSGDLMSTALSNWPDY